MSTPNPAAREPGMNVADDHAAAALHRARESLDLRLDHGGHFWTNEGPVAHPGVAALFLRSISAREGRLVVAWGGTYAFLSCDHAPLRVVHAALEGEAPLRLRIWLNDGREVGRGLSACFATGDGGLVISVPSADAAGFLWAQFNNHALSDLAHALEWSDDHALWRLPVSPPITIPLTRQT